jgi:hypothetical protein
MALKIRDRLGTSVPNATPAPRLAPATDYGLTEAGNTLGGAANRMMDREERARSIATAEAKQKAREAEFDAKQKEREQEQEQKRKQDEADRLDLYTRKQSFSEAGTTQFIKDFEEGRAAEAGYLENLTKDWDAKAAQEVADAPEPLRARLALELREARGQLLAQHRDTAINARTEAVASKAQGGLDSVVNETRIAPGMMEGNLVKVEQMVDALDVRAPIKTKLIEEYKGQVALASLEGRIEVNPAAVVRDIKAGKFGELLDPAKLNAALNAAQNEVERRAREAEAKARENEIRQRQLAAIAKAEQRDRKIHAAEMQAIRRASLGPSAQAAMMDNLASLSMSGRPSANAPSRAQMLDLVGPEGVARYDLAREKAVKTFAATGSFDALAPSELQQRVAGLRPKPGQAGYAEALEVYQGAAEKASNVLKARQTDPVAYWRGTEIFGDAVGRLRKSRPNLTQSQAETLILSDLQKRKGGATDGRVRLLSQDQAGALAAQLRPGTGTRGAGNALKLIDDLGKQYGPNAGLALADIADAGKLPQIAALSAIAPGARRTAAELLFAPTTTSLDNKGKKEVEAGLRRNLSPLLSSFGNSRGGREVADQAGVLGVTLVSQMEAQGVPRREAIQQVTSMFQGDYDFKEGLRFPQGVPNGPVLSGARQTRARILADPTVLAAVGGTPAMPEKQRQQEYRMRLQGQSGARWINTADDTGLMLVDGNGMPVRLKNGQLARFSWNELRSGDALR